MIDQLGLRQFKPELLELFIHKSNILDLCPPSTSTQFCRSAYPLYSSDESSYPWTRAVGGEDRVC